MREDESWVDIVSKATEEIKIKTNTVFRQNCDPVHKLDMNYVLTGDNWIGEWNSKDAIVTFSKSTLNLIVMPKIIVDEHIFQPIFEKHHDGYEFKDSCRRYEHRGRSIRIKFREESDSLIVTLCPGLKKDAPKIDLLQIPNEYWEKINIVSDEPLNEFIKTVVDRSENLSGGKGIKILGAII